MKSRNYSFAAALLLAIMMSSAAMANTATVEKVIQGDRLQIKGWEVVRFTGIIVPKLDEFCGREAYEFTRQQLEGKLVVMRTYTTDNTAAGIVRDEESLCLVQIEYGFNGINAAEKGDSTRRLIDFGALMLEKGLARVDAKYLPDWLQHYKNIEASAQEKKIGIWADPTSK